MQMTIGRGGSNPASGRLPGIDRILIVDDIEEMRQTLRRMLRYAGVATVELASGIDQARTALESARFRKAPFDLVFVDQMMPGGSGTELIEEVIARNLVDRRYTGLFVLSGVAEYEMQSQVKDSGAVALIEKPVSTEKLLAIAQRWVAYRNANRARAGT